MGGQHHRPDLPTKECGRTVIDLDAPIVKSLSAIAFLTFLLFRTHFLGALARVARVAFRSHIQPFHRGRTVTSRRTGSRMAPSSTPPRLSIRSNVKALTLTIYAWLFGWPVMYRANRMLMECALAGIGILNWRVTMLSGEVALARRLLKQSSRTSPVVIDVGAHRGDFLTSVLPVRCDATAYALEPNPASFADLVRNTDGMNVHCRMVAIGAKDGYAALHDDRRNPGSSHSSLYKEVVEGIHGYGATTSRVRIVQLGELLSELGVTEIALLKVDTEGAEREVLEGLAGAIASGSVTIDNMIIEFNEMNVVSKTFLRDLVSLLPRYEPLRILPRGALLNLESEAIVFREIFGYQNLLFRKRG